MCAIGKRLVASIGFLLSAAVAGAQDRPPTIDDIPPIDRHREHFYRALAVGPKGVEAKWLVSPETVAIDGELALTLIVANAANPTELLKPPLDKLEAFTRVFQVFLEADPPTDAAAREVRFRYRLRPRSIESTAIPALKYLYYRPEGGQFLTTFARGVAIAVNPPEVKVAPAVPVVPLDGPEEFFVERTAGSWELSVPRWAWLVPIGFAPIAALGWAFVWSAAFPSAARRARRRQSRAARFALRQLAKSTPSEDPAKFVAGVVRDYLAARLAIPLAAQTAGEVTDALRAADRPEGPTAATEAFFRACDVARFAPNPDHPHELVERAAWLVTGWEGVST